MSSLPDPGAVAIHDGAFPIGRDRETGAVVSLLGSACSGHGGALVIRGEAGIGKTTLLLLTQQLAEERGMRVLRCSGVQAETNLPFAALHQLLRPLLATASDVSAHHIRLLRAALGLEEGTAIDLYQVALATLELLAAAAVQRALLVAADDAHWMDRPSADVLAFVGRRVASEALAIVVAVRAGSGDPFSGGGLPSLALEPLGRAESASLLDRAAPFLAGDIRRRILQVAAGNPLALTQLPSTAHRWELALDRMPVAELLERSFAARVVALPETTRALLLAAAAAGTACALGELCTAAAGASATEVSAADIQPAIDARLVSLANQQVVFAHPLMASVIYQNASIDRRLRTHAALAAVVADDDRRAWHRAGAVIGHHDELALEMQALAERAARRGAVSVSIAALDQAALLTSDPTRAADTLLRASEQALELGRRAVAVNLVERADQSRLSPIGAARLIIVRDGLLPRDADDELSISDMIAAASAAQAAEDVDLAASVLWAAARRSYWTNASPRDRRALDTAARALGLESHDVRRIAILAYAGLLTDRGALEREIVSTSSHVRDATALTYLGSAALNLGNEALSAQLLTVGISATRARGQMGSIPRLQALHAWVLLWAGALDSVTVAADETERLSAELDQPMWHRAAIHELALATGFGGDYPLAKEQVLQGMLHEDIRQRPLFNAMALYGLGLVALGAGEYQDAYEHLRRIVNPTDPASHYAARQWVAGDLVEAAMRAGRLEECADLLKELGEDWQLDPTSSVRSGVAYGEAVLAGALGSAGEAQSAFDAMFEVEREADELDWARHRLAYGSWLRRQRRSGEARAALEEAAEVFDRIGMAGFARTAGRELRAAGGTGSRQLGSGLEALTPQELQIARLAADGLSNRQIAQTLFLSHRTVGSHLYHIFPKLGVAGRGELRRALPGQATPQ